MDNLSTFKAELPKLHAMLTFVCDKLSEYGVLQKELLKIEVALEEVIVNIINHAYSGDIGDIEIAYEHVDDMVVVRIRDYGTPFNPLAYQKQYDTTLSLEERESGGIGIHLIKEFMDKLEYTRTNAANELLLIKRLTLPS